MVVFGIEVVNPLVGKQPGRRVKLLVALGALFLALVGLNHVVLQVDPETSLVLEPGQPADRAPVPAARCPVRHGGEGVGLALLFQSGQNVGNVADGAVDGAAVDLAHRTLGFFCLFVRLVLGHRPFELFQLDVGVRLLVVEIQGSG